jgi:hypothetical protein
MAAVAAAIQALGIEARPITTTTKSKRQIHAATARALETWAAQKRLILGGKEGFAPRSIIDKIRRERDGAGQGRRGEQRWPEVYRGDGLLVQQVVTELGELPRMVVTCYYLFTGPWYVRVDEQAEAIGTSKTEYFVHLKVAEASIETGLKLLQRRPLEAIV